MPAMPSKRSAARSPERRAALDALSEVASGMRTDVLIAWLPLLAACAVRGDRRVSAGMVTRAIAKLRLLRRFAEQCEALKPVGFSDAMIADWVCVEAKANDPDIRVSPRSLQRWRAVYNRIGPDGLAAGPAALFPRYRVPPRGRRKRGPLKGR